MIPNNKEICEDYLNDLRVANEQWFYGYEFSREDYIKMVSALQFFENIRAQQREKLIKEGKL